MPRAETRKNGWSEPSEYLKIVQREEQCRTFGRRRAGSVLSDYVSEGPLWLPDREQTVG